MSYSQSVMISYNINIYLWMKKYISWVVGNLKNYFTTYDLNYHIWLNNTFRFTECSILIDNIHMEQTVSQNFDECLNFYLMKCRKLNQKESTKSSPSLS